MQLYSVYCIISAVYGCLWLHFTNILPYLYLTRSNRSTEYCYKVFKYHGNPGFLADI